MPNHVTSEVIFRDITPDQHADLTASIFNSDGDVDFNILVPTPLNLWLGNEGINHERAFGKRLGMTWSLENWGTKWNAYQSRDPTFTDGVLTIVFDTAWAPPYPWLVAVFNRFNLSFDHNWLDEGAEWGVAGTFRVARDDTWGPQWDEAPASQETQERLHTLKWSCAAFPAEDDLLAG